jgi:hypothetical protein
MTVEITIPVRPNRSEMAVKPRLPSLCSAVSRVPDGGQMPDGRCADTAGAWEADLRKNALPANGRGTAPAPTPTQDQVVFGEVRR